MGLTTPNPDAQEEVVRRAQELAGVAPSGIGYVEAHGTGTMIGDPMELRALTRAFGSAGDRHGYCAVGSVKSNIGHTLMAAGMAGLHKVVLALRHRRIPPTLHCETPNPRFNFDRSPFFPNTELRDFAPIDGVRRAGVSAFGFGGVNCHAILRERARRGGARRAAGRAPEPAAGGVPPYPPLGGTGRAAARVRHRASRARPVPRLAPFLLPRTRTRTRREHRRRPPDPAARGAELTMSQTHRSFDAEAVLRSLSGHRFATRVTAQDASVRDHLVHHTPVLPGVFHLDLVLRLVRHLGVDPSVVELKRCVFIRPLIAVGDLDRQLRVTVGERGERGAVPVTVRSRPLLGGEVADEEWQTNFQAEIHVVGPWEPRPVPAGRLDVASGPDSLDADDLYALARQLDIEHGPFMKVRGRVGAGADFSVADVNLDPSAVEQLGHFFVHPVFMDFSVLVPFLQFPEPVRRGIVQPFIPIYVDSFRARRPLEARTFWCTRLGWRTSMWTTPPRRSSPTSTCARPTVRSRCG
ncbi:polyketide synthase dehydratase domain-containing protein [Streptomyces sp. S1A(2023)]